MIGIILAGGSGTRLRPCTSFINKHLLPVGRKPMIYYPVEKLTQAGIKQILVVTGVEHMGDIVNVLGSGKEFGCQFTYRVQDEAGGIAQALGLASEFARGEKTLVILGDNVFEDDISREVHEFAEGRFDCAGRPIFAGSAHVFLKEVSDPGRFGVAEIVDDKIINIEEKPKEPKSNLAVTGIYMYDEIVFNVIKTLKPSQRGELEISDCNNWFLREGLLRWSKLNGWWTDAGTFDSLDLASKLARETWK